jgi:hypothetical protein
VAEQEKRNPAGALRLRKYISKGTRWVITMKETPHLLEFEKARSEKI